MWKHHFLQKWHFTFFWWYDMSCHMWCHVTTCHVTSHVMTCHRMWCHISQTWSVTHIRDPITSCVSWHTWYDLTRDVSRASTHVTVSGDMCRPLMFCHFLWKSAKKLIIDQDFDPPKGSKITIGYDMRSWSDITGLRSWSRLRHRLIAVHALHVLAQLPFTAGYHCELRSRDLWCHWYIRLSVVSSPLVMRETDVRTLRGRCMSSWQGYPPWGVPRVCELDMITS